MLYTKAMSEITWSDIEDFCKQKIEEGAYLDYKRDFPQQLEKTISAMANTLGGIVLVGIAEESDNKPVDPIEGIPFKRGLSERVMNIILTNITPPIFPEIGVCKNQAGDKAVIVIRIPQSHQAPHAIAGNRQVYLRTGNRNNPEELARIDEIQWLVSGRRKSEGLRREICERAEDRFQSVYENEVKNWTAKGQHEGKLEKGWLTLMFSPIFPKEMLRTPPEIRESLNKFTVPDYYRTSEQFPIFNNFYGMLVQDATIFSAYYPERVFHTELSCYGLYFYRQSLLRKGVFNGKELPIIWGAEIFCRLDEFIDSASKYFILLGYWGPLLFEARLTDVHGCPFDLPLHDDPRDDLYYCPDKQVTQKRELFANALADEKPRLVLETLQRIGWAFNIDMQLQFLRRFYVKIKHKDIFPMDFQG